MKKAGPLKKPYRTAFTSLAMVLFVWSIFLSCWCGAACGQDDGPELGHGAAKASHGCCAPPVEAPVADDCCDDPNGFHCCDAKDAELAPVETSVHIDAVAAAPIIELPDFLIPERPAVRTHAPRVPEVAYHGPPNYLRFESFLI